nr:GNAT family N-acetyltransferase [uncultured Eisenbergiella sp.]
MAVTKRKPVQLILAQKNDAQLIHQLKKEAFMPLYETYRDTDTNPALDPVDKVVCQLAQEETDYWLISYEGRMAGGVRVVHKKDANLISPLFILPKEQNKGIATCVMKQLFDMYPDVLCWKLVTIREEKRNCHFYEKLGFCNTLSAEESTGYMTLIGYERYSRERKG